MDYTKTMLKLIFFRAKKAPLGRWSRVKTKEQLMKRIDLANNDNCYGGKRVKQTEEKGRIETRV